MQDSLGAWTTAQCDDSDDGSDGNVLRTVANCLKCGHTRQYTRTHRKWWRTNARARARQLYALVLSSVTEIISRILIIYIFIFSFVTALTTDGGRA